MSEDLLLKTYNKTLEIHAEQSETRGEVMRIAAAFTLHERDCLAWRKEVSRRFADTRGRLASVTDEIEDTKSRDIRTLRARAELPRKVAVWAARVMGAVVLMYFAHRILSLFEGKV